MVKDCGSHKSARDTLVEYGVELTLAEDQNSIRRQQRIGEQTLA